MSTKKAQRNPRPPSLTESELKKILSAAQNNPVMEDLHNLVTIISRTGIRAGEMVRLRWSDVDLDKGQLVVDAKIGKHAIPFDAECRKAFAALHARRPKSGLVLGDSPSGVRYRMSRQLRTLSAQIGMRPITFQLLRHTFFTRLANAGVSASVIMAIGGWKSTYVSLVRFIPVSEPVIKREYDAALGSSPNGQPGE